MTSDTPEYNRLMFEKMMKEAHKSPTFRWFSIKLSITEFLCKHISYYRKRGIDW